MHELKTASKDWHIEDFATTEEWAEARRDGVGASSAGVLLGISHYKKNTPLRLYNLTQGLEEPDKPSYAMKLGHLEEYVTSALFAEATGAVIMEESAHDFLCVDNAKPWRRISPDRFFWLPGTPEAEQTVDNAEMLELKYIGAFEETATCRHKPVQITPENFVDLYPEYYAQVQYQMGVCRKKRVFVAWRDKNFPGDDDFHYLEIEFSKGYFEMMMKAVDDFWENHILKCVPPTEVRNDEDLVRKYPRPVPKTTMTASDELLDMVRRNRVLDHIKKNAENQQKELNKVIGEAMNINEKLLDAEGNRLLTWSARKGTSYFDEDAFKAENPDEYRKYTGAFDSEALKAADPALYGKYVREKKGARPMLFADITKEVYDSMVDDIMAGLYDDAATAAAASTPA